jgi:Na+-translocating ferredoxin:NAD+ oxidoreductase subunit B
VDCILVEDATPGRTGWDAWSDVDAEQARARYGAHRERTQRALRENDQRLAAKAQAKLADLADLAAASSLTDPAALERKRAVIEAAMQRAKERAAKAPR